MRKINNYLLIFVFASVSGCAAPGKVRPVSQDYSAKKQLIHNYCYQYVYGDYGTQIDYRRAQQWCRRGADEGVASSQALLAELHFFGQGVPQDFFRALHWYRQAAQQDHVHAQFMLYHMLSKGLGTLPDESQARQWLEQSAASGHLRAKALLDAGGAALVE